LNWRWAAGQEKTDDGKTVVVYSNGEEPERLNPLYASTVYAWNVMNPLLDGLLAVNPYTHEDVPWLADSWTVTPTAAGMEIVFNLNSTVTWQCGNAYTAEDAEFNMEFMRDNAIPRYTSAWQNIVDVQVVSGGAGGTIKVILDKPSQFLLYDVAGIAAILPPPVWSPLDGKPQATILGYDPTANTTKPTGAGPKFGQADGPQTQLYGTGPYVFQFYDAVEQYADLYANRNYFKDTAEIARALTEMFHAVGDVNRDGHVGIHDLSRIGLSFGYFKGEPEYDADADINGDGIVDTRDIALLSAHWCQRKEYP
jgi:ABC-type transport system substrate-binding protein